MGFEPDLVFNTPEGAWLASQPIHLGSEMGEGQRCKRGRLKPPPQASPGGEFAVVLCNRPRQVARSVLLPPPLIVIVLLPSGLRFPAHGVHPATQAAHVAPALLHLFRCTTTITPAAAPELLPHLYSCTQAGVVVVTANAKIEECFVLAEE